MAFRNEFRPGGRIKIPANVPFERAVAPLNTPRGDLGDSVNEEAIIDRSADNVVGASELRSGRETPVDPRSPAAKTALLLQQSSIRLDDFLLSFILNENKLLDRAKKLYYQYNPDGIKFSIPVEKGQEAKDIEIKRAMFNSEKIHLQLAITSLADNPDFLKQRWEDIYAKYQGEFLLGGQPETRWQILNHILLNSPETRGVPLLLPYKEILQKMQTQGGGIVPQPGVAGGGAPAGVSGIQEGLKQQLAGAAR